jgi:DNA-binding beta-propeller fold protein YncE
MDLSLDGANTRRAAWGARRHSRVWGSLLLVATLSSAAPDSASATDLASPTGRTGLIMVDKVGGHVRFFDPTTDQELASFVPGPDVSIRPHELAISPDHKTAYVTVYGDGVYGKNPHPGHTIAIIDLRSHQMIGSIDVSPYQAPHGIQVDASGTLYVACDLSRKVLIVDPVKRRITAAIDVEGTGHRLALLPDASKLYVANKDDRLFISVVDVKARKMVGRVPMPDGTEGIVASPDGKRVLAADLKRPYVHVISTASDAEIDKVPVLGAEHGIYRIFYSPDGMRVLTCISTGQVNIFRAADLHAPQGVVHSAGTAVMGIAFSADGKTALVGNHGEGTVSRIDLEKATLIDTFPAGKGVESLAFF